MTIDPHEPPLVAQMDHWREEYETLIAAGQDRTTARLQATHRTKEWVQEQIEKGITQERST